MTTQYIPTPANDMQSFAGAVFGMAIDYPTMVQILAWESGAGNSANAYMNAIVANPAVFGSSTNAQIAATVTANVAATAGWASSSAQYTQFTAYVTALLNQNPTNKGVAILTAVNTLESSPIQSDAFWGAGASNFTAAASAAGTYASLPGNVGWYTLASGAPSTAWTLTSGTDIFTATAANNTFNAGLNSLGAVTLNNSDQITGGSGSNNSMNVVLAGGVVKPNLLSHIQSYNIQNTAISELDFTNSDSVGSITVNGNVGVQTLSNLQSATTTYTLANTNQGMSLTLGTGVGAGTADVANVTLNNATGAAVLTVPAAFETLALTSTGTSNSVSVSTFAGTAGVTVSGSSALNLNVLGSGQNVNAANLSGVLTVTAFGNNSITGGSGNDVISAAGSTGHDTLVGGAGTNTFQLTGVSLVNETITGGSSTDTIQFTGSSITSTSDAYLKSVTAVEVLTLGGTGGNSLTLGATAWAAGITTINGSATGGDTITITSAPTASLLVNGAGADILNIVNTAAASVSINNVTTVNELGTAVALTIGGTAVQAATATIAGGTGVDSLTISNSGTAALSVQVANVETVNATGSSQADTITLASSTSAATVTLNNIAGNVVIDASGVADSITGGTAADTFKFANAAAVTTGLTIAGNGGNDVIQFTGSSITSTSDAYFKNISSVEVLTLGGTGGNSLTLGATAWAAGITTINGSTSGADVITITSAPTNGVNFVGLGGTDTLILGAKAANSSYTISNIATITDGATSTSSVNAFTIGGTNNTVSSTLTGGASGLDTLTIASSVTSGVTVSVAGFAAVTGGVASDVITVAATGTVAITGGGTASAVVTSASSGTTNLNLSNVKTVNNSNTSDTVIATFTTAAVATATNVQSIIGSSGNDTLTSTITGTAIAGTTYRITDGPTSSTGNDNLTVNFISSSVTGTQAAFTVLAVAGAGNDTITLGSYQANSMTATQYNIAVAGAGHDIVYLAAATAYSGVTGGATTVVNIARDDLTNYTSGDVQLADTLEVYNFQVSSTTAGGSVFTSRINLNGVTLTSANGNTTSSSTDTGTGGTNYSAVFATETTAQLADFGAAGLVDNSGKSIFQDSAAITTASLTTQAGITAAVSFITANIGTSGASATENALIIVNDGTNSAMFHFVQAAGSAASIQAGELTLVGVLHGAAALTASNFS